MTFQSWYLAVTWGGNWLLISSGRGPSSCNNTWAGVWGQMWLTQGCADALRGLGPVSGDLGQVHRG